MQIKEVYERNCISRLYEILLLNEMYILCPFVFLYLLWASLSRLHLMTLYFPIVFILELKRSYYMSKEIVSVLELRI